MTVLRDERERGWFHLDNAVIDTYLPKIGPTAFSVYACIVRHADRKGNAFPSYTLLQKELGCGRTQVADAIKKIVDVGLVTITAGKRRANIYHVITVSTSPDMRLVPNQDQSQSETSTSPESRPVLVPNRDSNNTQGRRPKEQDPLVASLPARAPAKPRVLVADYQPDERQIALAIGYGVPSEQIAFETEKWRDYHAAKGDVVKDAPASWRTWMRNAVTYAAKDRASPNGQYKNNAEKTQDVIRRYAEMIERNEKNGTAEDHEQSPTVRAHIAHRSVPLDDG